MVDDLYAAQRGLAANALAHAETAKGADAVAAWSERRKEDVARVLAFLEELERGNALSIAKLALANSQIQKLAAGSS